MADASTHGVCSIRHSTASFAKLVANTSASMASTVRDKSTDSVLSRRAYQERFSISTRSMSQKIEEVCAGAFFGMRDYALAYILSHEAKQLYQNCEFLKHEVIDVPISDYGVTPACIYNCGKQSLNLPRFGAARCMFQRRPSDGNARAAVTSDRTQPPAYQTTEGVRDMLSELVRQWYTLRRSRK